MTIQNATVLPSTMSVLTQSVDRLSSQYTTLSGEVSSGVVADSYAGLGDGRYLALSLQPEISKIGAWQENVTAAQSTLNITQTAMSRITTIATNLQTSLVSLQGDSGTTNVAAAAVEARDALTELGTLLNTKSGSQYVFAGSASDTAPVTDPDSLTTGPYFNAIAASVSSIGTVSAASVEEQTVTSASSNSGSLSVFSSALSVGATDAAALTHSVAIGDQENVATGFVATSGGAASTTSTGSAIRDLMRALAVVGNLDKADTATSAFSSLVNDTATQMGAVSSSLNLTIASLGSAQDQLTTRSSTLSVTGDALAKQLDTVKGSDPATLSTQITDTQNQLQASYSLIADMKGMTLASYI